MSAASTKPTPALGLAAADRNGHDSPIDRIEPLDHEASRRQAEDAIPRGLAPEEYARLAAVNSFRSGSESAACYQAVGGMTVEVVKLTKKHDELVAMHVGLARRLDAVLPWIERQMLQEAEVIPPMRPKLPSLREEDLGEPIEKTSNGTPIYKTSQPQLRAYRETAYSDALAQAAIGEAERTQAAIDHAFREYHARQVQEAEVAELRTKAAPVVWVLTSLPKVALAVLTGLAVSGVMALGAWLHSLFLHR